MVLRTMVRLANSAASSLLHLEEAAVEHSYRRIITFSPLAGQWRLLAKMSNASSTKEDEGMNIEHVQAFMNTTKLTGLQRAHIHLNAEQTHKRA
jgi:hypothetical protein